MKAEEADEKHYREEKYASIYEINMLRCIFLWFVWGACQRCDLFDFTKVLVPSSYERRLYFGKDRLVMPLDMAIKMLNLS
jgi:NADH-quinone oxidoreductase subunit I